jgi:pimeloyl-ACP methyl ester carboxylesterase
MHSVQAHEDRVFGTPTALPANSLVNRASRSYDLLSVGVRGEDAAYAQEGRLALPPLVLLHGWGASHKFWRTTLSAFSPRRRVIAPDLPGFGVSSKAPRDWTVEGYAAWLGDFLDALRLPSVELAGHSMGGTIALLFALARPERVSRLVLVNPVVHGKTAFSDRYRAYTNPLVRRIVFSMLKSPKFRAKVCTDFTCVGPLDDELARDITAAPYRACVQALDSVRAVDLRERARALRVPALSIGTELDRVIHPDQHLLAGPAKTLRLEMTGHIPMVERPAEFNRAVADFLGLGGGRA